MVKNVKVIKVEVEKSELKSYKTVTIKNMKNEIIAEMNVFSDGSIFIGKCLDVYIADNKVAKIELEAPATYDGAYYHHVKMNEEYNTQLINWKKVE